jgi:heme/copper-type cytochrome/quinol oxidase subunit 2
LGVEDIAETFLVIIVLLILMVVLRKRSEPDRHKAMNTVKNIKLWVSAAFSLAWFVAGSVWTFSVKSRVQFDNFQKPDYCHSTPYWCAFVLCVIWYSHIPIAILLALRVWKIEKGKSNLNSSINPEWTVKF